MLTPEEVEDGLKVLMNSPQPVLVIMCRPPTKTILNFGEREQMEGVIERSTRIIERYDALIDKMNLQGKVGSLDFCVYDWTKPHSWIYNLVRNHIESIRGEY